MIVDSQLHIWPSPTPERPRPAAFEGRVHLPNPFTYEMAIDLMDGAGVDKAILVPPSWELERLDYALEAVANNPGRFAVMGRVALNRPEVEMPRLKIWRDTPSLLGVRVVFIYDEDSSWLTDGTSDWFWAVAEEYGIPVMILAPEDKPALHAIAKRHPELTLIIDHMGLSMNIFKENRTVQAVEDAARLSDCPNVCVKLSSVPTYSNEDYPFNDMTPLIQRLFTAYGRERCFWGTDVTRDYDKVPYKQRVTHFTETLEFLGDEDKEWVMGRALCERLRWDGS